MGSLMINDVSVLTSTLPSLMPLLASELPTIEVFQSLLKSLSHVYTLAMELHYQVETSKPVLVSVLAEVQQLKGELNVAALNIEAKSQRKNGYKKSLKSSINGKLQGNEVSGNQGGGCTYESKEEKCRFGSGGETPGKENFQDVERCRNHYFQCAL